MLGVAYHCLSMHEFHTYGVARHFTLQLAPSCIALVA